MAVSINPIDLETTLPIASQTLPFYNVVNAIWPDLYNQQATIAPPRNGMDRFTGKLLQGWDHTQQSIAYIFATKFHTRPMRRWVGSFVPHILGESYIPRVVTRFYWAMASAIDLQEPDYRIKQVAFMGQAIQVGASPLGTVALSDSATVGMVRLGQALFRHHGIFYPRGHLGDFTPYELHMYGVVSRGGQVWDVVNVSNG